MLKFTIEKSILTIVGSNEDLDNFFNATIHTPAIIEFPNELPDTNFVIDEIKIFEEE